MRKLGLPAAMATLATIATAFLLLPLLALAWRTPWARTGELVTNPAVTSALKISLVASLCSVVLAVVLGVPLAWVLARMQFRGKRLLRALVTLPMVLPPVVGGVALLLAFGRSGIIGGPFNRLTGLSIPFSLAAVVMAAAFVSMPFMVIILEGAFNTTGPRFEEVAATLGASRWTAFRRVTLPMIGPSLGSGLALTWARAIGEFGATITFAGNLPGRTQTMPLAVFLELESNPEVAYLLSMVMLGVAVIALLAARGRMARP